MVGSTAAANGSHLENVYTSISAVKKMRTVYIVYRGKLINSSYPHKSLTGFESV